MKLLIKSAVFFAFFLCSIRTSYRATAQVPRDNFSNEEASWYEVTNYDVSCEISPVRRSLAVTALLTLRALHNDVTSVRVFLHKEFTVKSASSGKQALKFTPLGQSRDKLFFSPTGTPLDIELPQRLNKGDRTGIQLAYGGEISSVINEVNLVSEPLTELALYSSWFPLVHEGAHFTYSLKITLPVGFICITDGEPLQKTDDGIKTVYIFRRDQPGMDIPIVVSNSLKVKRLEVPGFRAEMYYRNLEDALAGEFIQKFIDGYRLLEQKVGGAVGTGRLVFVVSPRSGWGYSRVPLFVVPEVYMLKVLSEADGKMESMHGCLHEMGHFWWRLASSATSDDWINESLAEFFSLYACEQFFGREPVNRVLGRYVDRVKRLKDAKPIVETLRTDKNGDVLYYEKGALIWEMLRQKLGDQKLFDALRRYYSAHRSGPPATTQNLIEAFSAETKGDTNAFFQEFLKTNSLTNLRIELGVGK